VDYWDYLGWPDRFGQVAFTKRQRVIASFNRSRTIYTPQLVLQGRDFRRHRSLKQHVTRINQTQPRANISLRVTPQAGTLDVLAEAKILSKIAPQPAVMFVALYENNLSSDVTAGENAGHTLNHNYVVRRWIGPLAPNPQGTVRWKQQIALEKDWKPRDIGVVVCVLNQQDGDVLQAVALPLHDHGQSR
jgi:hypothetical protein